MPSARRDKKPNKKSPGICREIFLQKRVDKGERGEYTVYKCDDRKKVEAPSLLSESRRVVQGGRRSALNTFREQHTERKHLPVGCDGYAR